MKDIRTILSENLELTEEQVKTIADLVNENYKTINEYNKKTERLAQLEEQNSTLTEQVGNLEGQGEEIEKLRSQVEEFKLAENEQKEKEAEALKRESFKVVFDAAVGNREFANDLIRDSIFNRVYETSDVSNAKEKLEELTKDVNGVWKNPQQESNKMPDPGEMSTNKTQSVDAAKKEIANFLTWGKNRR